MRIYFYAHTDNRTGLERLRRSVALAKELQKEFEIYFMTTEFRSAQYVKEQGIKKSVGIEDFRNIANVCERGDILIYDSAEHNEAILKEMIDFTGRFFRISYDANDYKREKEILISPYIVGEGVINAVLIDSDFFESTRKDIAKSFFYSDSDYERWVEKTAPKLAPFEFEFIEGFYFFLDSQEKLRPYFKAIHPIEEYKDIIKRSSIFLSASGQSALEAAASGAKVLFFQREDDDEYLALLERVGIKNIGFFDEKKLEEALLNILEPKRAFLENFSVKKAAQKIVSLL